MSKSTQQNKSDVGNRIFSSGIVAQLLGVTAGLFGFLIFLFSRLNYSLAQGYRPFLIGWPIYVAYLITFASLLYFLAFPKSRFWTNPKAALKYIYALVWVDIIMLTILVWKTGGVKNSIFMPIFLLIPTITAAYCDPRRFGFWFATISTFASAIFLSFSYEEILTASSQYANIEAVWTNIYTSLCILCAAITYAWTHSIKYNYCFTERDTPNERHNICEELKL